jgi:5-methylcytosine-specific restriction endonuclease McrA
MTETVNKSKLQLYRAEYSKRRLQDPEEKRKAAERTRLWREKNTERSRATTKEWQKNNKARVASYAAQRYLLCQKSKAAWVDVEMQRKILEVYEAAEQLTTATGIHHQVDHIVPLRGKTVCGLHVWWNLQVLPKLANINKSAKFDPDIWPDQAKLAFV